MSLKKEVFSFGKIQRMFFEKENGVFVGEEEHIDKVLVTDLFKTTYFKSRVVPSPAGKNAKANKRKRDNKKKKEEQILNLKMETPSYNPSNSSNEAPPEYVTPEGSQE